MNKVWLCAIAKIENKYLREWVEHYKNIGIEKIILYDNNDIDGEKFNEVIDDYINNGFVKINNYRGLCCCQSNAYYDCYNNYSGFCDWIAFLI